jgi:hypothetical protein
MRYFSVTFEWKTRPLFRKGRLVYKNVAYAARDLTDAYRLAQDDGHARFPRHKWKIVACVELTYPQSDDHALVTSPVAPIPRTTT